MTPAYFGKLPDGKKLAIVRAADIGYTKISPKATCLAFMCPECKAVYHWLAAHECGFVKESVG